MKYVTLTTEEVNRLRRSTVALSTIDGDAVDTCTLEDVYDTYLYLDAGIKPSNIDLIKFVSENEPDVIVWWQNELRLLNYAALL